MRSRHAVRSDIRKVKIAEAVRRDRLPIDQVCALDFKGANVPTLFVDRENKLERIIAMRPKHVRVAPARGQPGAFGKAEMLEQTEQANILLELNGEVRLRKSREES